MEATAQKRTSRGLVRYLATHHSPLTTHHSPLTTHHSPLTTHHSPLTTHPSLLTTHHLERRMLAQDLDFFGDCGPFARQIACDRFAQPGVRDPVGRMGRDRDIAARELVFALRPGLDARKAMLDGEVYGLV